MTPTGKASIMRKRPLLVIAAATVTLGLASAATVTAASAGTTAARTTAARTSATAPGPRWSRATPATRGPRAAAS